MAYTDLKATLLAFINTVWNAGDFSHLNDFVCEHYTIKHDPGDAWDGQTIDRETFVERVMYSRNAFPDLTFDIQEMVAETHRVVAFWMMSGTHEGDLATLPATGKTFKVSGITIYDFDADGKVCGHTQAYDRLGFVQQMGLMRG